MNSSTGLPAFTISITLRGDLRDATSSGIVCAPAIFFPFARPFMKSSTFATVRLKTLTEKPRLSMFNTRFSPITARPMSPMSDFSTWVRFEVVRSIPLYPA